MEAKRRKTKSPREKIASLSLPFLLLLLLPWTTNHRASNLYPRQIISHLHLPRISPFLHRFLCLVAHHSTLSPAPQHAVSTLLHLMCSSASFSLLFALSQVGALHLLSLSLWFCAFEILPSRTHLTFLSLLFVLCCGVWDWFYYYSANGLAWINHYLTPFCLKLRLGSRGLFSCDIIEFLDVFKNLELLWFVCRSVEPQNTC